jgi:hypothetical protein
VNTDGSNQFVLAHPRSSELVVLVAVAIAAFAIVMSFAALCGEDVSRSVVAGLMFSAFTAPALALWPGHWFLARRLTRSAAATGCGRFPVRVRRVHILERVAVVAIAAALYIALGSWASLFLFLVSPVVLSLLWAIVLVDVMSWTKLEMNGSRISIDGKSVQMSSNMTLTLRDGALVVMRRAETDVGGGVVLRLWAFPGRQGALYLRTVKAAIEAAALTGREDDTAGQGST